MFLGPLNWFQTNSCFSNIVCLLMSQPVIIKIGFHTWKWKTTKRYFLSSWLWGILFWRLVREIISKARRWKTGKNSCDVGFINNVSLIWLLWCHSLFSLEPTSFYDLNECFEKMFAFMIYKIFQQKVAC